MPLRASTRTRIVDLQRELGTTTLYVTHDQVEAMTMGHRIAVLNQGQSAAARHTDGAVPLALKSVCRSVRRKPADECASRHGGLGWNLLLGERRLPVEGIVADALPALEGQNLNGGIRPEHLRISPATNRNLPAEVSHSEVLGNEQLITCSLLDGGHLVQVRADPDLEVVPGSRLTWTLSPPDGGCSIFLGEAIARPQQSRWSDDEPVLPNLG